MHRTHFVLRLLGWWSLLVGLLFHAGITTACAQESVPVIAMTAGTTQFFPSPSKLDLVQVENSNPKVLNVSGVAGDPKTVLFEAIGPGRTKVKLTDVKKNSFLIDVVVVNDRVAELRNLIKNSVPTASVTVNATDSGNAVILSGFVLTTDEARVIQQVAGQLFGANVVNNIRIGGVQQVQVEVVVAVVDRSEARNMSFSFVENQNTLFLSSVFGAPLSFASNIATAASSSTSNLTQSGAANIPFGIMTQKSSFLGFLQALRTEGLAKIHSEPRVMTLSGRPGQIVSGGEVPILTASGVGAPSVSYKQFGTVVTFLPIVLGNGKIHIEVTAEVSDINTANGINIPGVTPTIVPGFNTRRAQAAVQMEDGQTLAIGGLIQNKINATVSRIPILGDIPFLSTAFSSKSYTESEEELLIMVTPRLVDPVDCCKIPKYLPGRETRTPDDFEFFLEGILEAPRGPRNVSWNPLHYQASHTLPGAAGAYPCGDASGCYGHNRNGGNGNCANGACNTGSPYTAGLPLANGQANPGAGLTMPPASRNLSSLPVSNKIQQFEPQPPSPMPQGQEVPPSLGPAAPISPPAPMRELENRTVLPPVSFGSTSKQ